jgi:hypothetical protein
MLVKDVLEEAGLEYQAPYPRCCGGLRSLGEVRISDGYPPLKNQGYTAVFSPQSVCSVSSLGVVVAIVLKCHRGKET